MLRDAFRFVLSAHHEARDVLQEQQRNAALAGELDEMRAFDRALAEQHAVVGEDRDRDAPDVGEAADEGRAVKRLELVELAAVDDAGDHLMHVVRRANVLRDDAVELFGVVRRWPWFPELNSVRVERSRDTSLDYARDERRWEGADDVADNGQRVLVIFGEMIDDAGFARVQVAAAQFLGADLLASCRLNQRRAAEEDRALLADDHALVAHCRDIGAARGAAAHDAGDLRDSFRGHLRLVEEDPPEM